MITKLITKLAREARKKAKEQHKAKIKSIKAGKGTANEKFKKMDKANDILLKKLKQAKIKDAKDARKAESFKKAQRMMKKKPAVRVSPGGKGKDAPAKPVGLGSDKLGKGVISQRRRKQRIKNEIEASKFKRYIRDMDLEDLQNLPTGNKAAFERLKSAELDRQLPKSERDAMYKLFSKRYNLLKAKRLKQGKPVPKLKKGGMTMPMHGKKKSKMMARGGMKKKSKMMARGGMKKSKMMARGGMKKTKSYARGGAARRK